MYAPIIIMVYDRLDHFKNLVASLLNDPLAKYSDLYVISDAAYKEDHVEKVEAIRQYARTIKGFHDYYLIENAINMGANDSYRYIISLVYKKHDRVIFFEDDNLVTSNYLQFMNDAFDKYKDNPRVVFVCGYNFPIEIPASYKFDVYFYPTVCAWGYGMWKSKYIDVYDLTKGQMRKDKKTLRVIKKSSSQLYHILMSDLYSERVLNDARIGYIMAKNNLVALFPRLSLVKNTGHDGSGLHCGQNDFFQNQIKHNDFIPKIFPEQVFIDNGIKNEMKKYTGLNFKNFIKGNLKLIYLRIKFLTKSAQKARQNLVKA